MGGSPAKDARGKKKNSKREVTSFMAGLYILIILLILSSINELLSTSFRRKPEKDFAFTL